MLKVTRLAVEHQTESLSLDVKQPCFGWVLDSDGKNVRQAAYALTVEADGRPVWDTGRVDSGESVSVRYEGAPLKSKTVYQVRLTVWDNRGETAQAETAFETGLLEPGDFAARWITHDFPRGETACPVFFKAFSARRPLRARLYASACGIYDAAINGVPVSEDFFAPGWTDYKRRIQYQTYDVTSFIREENRIELTAAPGWYAGELNGASGHYGDRVAVWVQLHLREHEGVGGVPAKPGGGAPPAPERLPAGGLAGAGPGGGPGKPWIHRPLPHCLRVLRPQHVDRGPERPGAGPDGGRGGIRNPL